MQNQNPYGQLAINPTNYVQVVPNPQQQNVVYVQQYVQYPQGYPNQQPMIVYQPYPVDQQIIVDSELIQHQSPKLKKRFSMLITFLCLIQTIMMFYSAIMIYQRYQYKDFFIKNGQIKWPSYMVILATIAAVIAGRLCKPPKDRFKQGSILVGMTVLWTLFAGVISSIFGLNYYFLYVCMLSYDGLAYIGILVTYALIQPEQYNNIQGLFVQKLLLIVYLLPIGILSFLAILIGGVYGIFAAYYLLIFGVLGMAWSSAFGFVFLHSLGQFLKGKFELKMYDVAAGAILVYGNMVPL